MAFEKRNVRHAIKKRETKQMFRSFPEKMKSRVDRISEKMKSVQNHFPIFTKEVELKKPGTSSTIKNQKPSLLAFVIFCILFPLFFYFLYIPVLGKIPVENIKQFTTTFEDLRSTLESDDAPDIQSILRGKTKTIIKENLGQEIEKNKDGITNILLLGVGGKGHDGENLTDSIILVSLNHNTSSVTMVSIPRDLYVYYNILGNPRSGRINQVFRDGVNYWKYRENDDFIIREKAAVEIKEVVKKITGQSVHYTALIDFKGFEKIVDTVGGITVDVEKRIYDELYPDNNYGYELFTLKTGVQKMDGETALKYARTRHGNSDFDRSRRQKKALMALKDQAIENGIIQDTQKLSEVFEVVQDHFWTDLSAGEILTLFAFSIDIPKENIISYGINNNPNEGVGGFLFTPLRENFNGASVLVPFLSVEPEKYDNEKDFAQIHFFVENLIYNPDVIKSPHISVYNGSGTTGLANTTKIHLERYGFLVKEIGNANQTIPTTTVEYLKSPENEKIISFLKRKLKAEYKAVDAFAIQKPVIDQETGEEVPPILQKNSPIQITIGQDFRSGIYGGSLIRIPLSAEKKLSDQFLEIE